MQYSIQYNAANPRQHKCISHRCSTEAVQFLIADPQVGFYPGRTYDENVALVRGTLRDLNGRRAQDGGLMLFLDNEKAFDRVQHQFMYDVLDAFGLPAELISAVKTLYNGANTAVKANGEIGLEESAARSRSWPGFGRAARSHRCYTSSCTRSRCG